MMNIKTKLVAAVAALSLGASVVASAASNNLVLVTDQSKASVALVSLDFQSDGRATGIEARIQVGGGEKVKVDTSSCLKSLPKSHTGSCVFNGKEIVVLVYSMKNALLPVGLLDFGTVKVSGSMAKSRITVSSVISGAPSGDAIDSGFSVDGSEATVIGSAK